MYNRQTKDYSSTLIVRRKTKQPSMSTSTVINCQYACVRLMPDSVWHILDSRHLLICITEEEKHQCMLSYKLSFSCQLPYVRSYFSGIKLSNQKYFLCSDGKPMRTRSVPGFLRSSSSLPPSSAKEGVGEWWVVGGFPRPSPSPLPVGVGDVLPFLPFSLSLFCPLSSSFFSTLK